MVVVVFRERYIKNTEGWIDYTCMGGEGEGDEI